MGICQSHTNEVRIVKEPNDLRKQISHVNLPEVADATMESKNPPHEVNINRQRKVEREKVAIVCCPNVDAERPDKVVVIDVDPTRQTCGQVLSFVELPTTGDELIHIGWSRTAATEEEMKSTTRNYLIAPCLNSSRIYVFHYDNERISLHKCVGEEHLLQKDLSSPYGVHSLPERGTPLFVSTLGDRHGHAKGDFVMLDRKTFDVRERRESVDEFSEFGGDFAAQPRFEYMISTEWGHPRLFKHGFIPGDLENGAYGNKLNVWRIQPRRLKQVIELDPFDGCMTIAVRFLHNKEVNHGFACSAYGSTIFHIHVDSVTGRLCAEKAIQMESIEVEGWMVHRMPAMTTDLVISLDDRFMYASAWLHGYIAQYDIIDPFRVTLCSKVYVGGSLLPMRGVKTKLNSIDDFSSDGCIVNGITVRGGPSSLQLSLDGKRLYVTTSFYRVWDAQFFPDLLREGATMLLVDVNTRETGGMTLNRNFVVDFGAIGDGGPYLARSIRLQGGDCTSESFV